VFPRRSSFRLIAAINRSTDAIKQDIAARLTLRVETPDLNERREDVPLLVTHLLRKWRQTTRLSPSASSSRGTSAALRESPSISCVHW
jgi:DNA-binding NtrC family response regulator